MSFRKKYYKYGKENLIKSQDQVFSEIFQYYFFYFIEKKEHKIRPFANDNAHLYFNNDILFFLEIFKKFSKSFFKISLLALPFFVVLRLVAPFPREAKAGTPPPLQASARSTVTGKGSTLSCRDVNFRHNKKFIIAALQPKLTNRAQRGPISLGSALRMHTFHIPHNIKTTTTSYTHFGYSFIHISDRNQVITMSSLRYQQVRLTKQHLVSNVKFTP